MKPSNYPHIARHLPSKGNKTNDDWVLRNAPEHVPRNMKNDKDVLLHAEELVKTWVKIRLIDPWNVQEYPFQPLPVQHPKELTGALYHIFLQRTSRVRTLALCHGSMDQAVIEWSTKDWSRLQTLYVHDTEALSKFLQLTQNCRFKRLTTLVLAVPNLSPALDVFVSSSFPRHAIHHVSLLTRSSFDRLDMCFPNVQHLGIGVDEMDPKSRRKLVHDKEYPYQLSGFTQLESLFLRYVGTSPARPTFFAVRCAVHKIDFELPIVAVTKEELQEDGEPEEETNDKSTNQPDKGQRH